MMPETLGIIICTLLWCSKNHFVLMCGSSAVGHLQIQLWALLLDMGHLARNEDGGQRGCTLMGRLLV